MLQAAEHFTCSDPRVIFLLVGEGAEKQALQDMASRKLLKNVIFLDQKPRAQMPGIIRASDACLVLLKKQEIFKTVIPTKLLEFMSCGKPVILGVDGQAREIVESAGGGLCFEPQNEAGLVAAIRELVSHSALGQQLGEGGRRWIVDHLSRRMTAIKYLDVLRSVCESPLRVRADSSLRMYKSSRNVKTSHP